MSYDFALFRLQNPAARLKDVDETTVSMENWFDSARATLLQDFSDFGWEERDGSLRGAKENSGRFEVRLTILNGVTHVWVNGSFRADQRAEVTKLAEALGAVAFDVQTGERLEGKMSGRESR